MARTFAIIGQDLVISDQTLAYASLKNRFETLADKSVNLFQSQYQKRFKDLEAVLAGASELGFAYILEAVKVAHKILIENEIFDVDLEQFVSDYYESWHEFRDAIGELEEQFVEIVAEGEELEEYRRLRKESRGRVIGGGFGVEGFVKGAVTAGALNMASGAMHSFVNAIGRARTARAIEKKKAALFNDPETLKRLSVGLYLAIAFIKYDLLKVLEERGNLNYNGYASTEDERKAKSMFQNLRTYSVDASKEQNLLRDILKLDPFQTDYYFYTVQRYGDKDGQLEDLAKIFNIDLAGFKLQLLDKAYDQLDLASEKAAQWGKVTLTREIERLGVRTTPACMKRLDELLQNFDLTARTVGATTFATREEAEKARGQAKQLQALFRDFEKMDEQAVLELRDRIQDSSRFLPPIVEPYLNMVAERLEEIDREARTFNGTEFSTREEAKRAADEDQQLATLFVGVDRLAEAELLEFRAKIANRFRTTAVDRYMRILDERLHSLDVAARSVNGITYASREEARAAVDQAAQLRERLVDLDRIDDESRLQEIRSSITTGGYDPHTAAPFLQRIDEKLLRFNIERENDALRSAASRLDWNNEAQVRQFSAWLDSLRTPAKAAHQDKVRQRIAQFDERTRVEQERFQAQLELARKWEERERQGCFQAVFTWIIMIAICVGLIVWLGPWGIALVALGVLGGLVNAAESRKNKKAWKRLTNKGKIPLPPRTPQQ